MYWTKATGGLGSKAACFAYALSRRPEPHLLEDLAPDEAVGIGDRLRDLVVVVPLGVHELHRLAGLLQRLGELARLALELGRLQRPVEEHDRRINPVQVPYRRQL